MFHNSLKDDSKKKKLERIKRARATRNATWFSRKFNKKKEDSTCQVGTKKNG
tara:strand:- start:1272 stop:1427 length:156 start_codon:yes stop_codon:yes gene_type:complete